MPASTRLMMTAVRKNGSANASVIDPPLLWSARTRQGAHHVLEMRQVAARRRCVARLRGYDDAQAGLAGQKFPRVVGEIGLLKEDRNLSRFDEVDELRQVLGRRRYSRHGLGLAGDLDSEGISEVGP